MTKILRAAKRGDGSHPPPICVTSCMILYLFVVDRRKHCRSARHVSWSADYGRFAISRDEDTQAET